MTINYMVKLPAKMVFIYDDTVFIALACDRAAFEHLLANGYLPAGFYEDLAKASLTRSSITFIGTRHI